MTIEKKPFNTSLDIQTSFNLMDPRSQTRQVTPPITNTRLWSSEETDQVITAIATYNRDFPGEPFPEHPFGKRFSFVNFKEKYLEDLQKTPKQLRERCVHHLYGQVLPHIRQQDIEAVKKAREQNSTSWTATAQHLHEVYFNKKHYYSENTIKNFLIKKESNVTKKRKTAEISSFAPEAKAIKQKNILVPRSLPGSFISILSSAPTANSDIFLTKEEEEILMNEFFPTSTLIPLPDFLKKT